MSVASPIGLWEISHHAEAEPLRADLGNPQQAGQTLECADRLAASHVGARCWQYEYVCERGGSGRRAEEDEEWRDAF